MSNKIRYIFKKNFKNNFTLKKGQTWKIDGYRETSPEVLHLAKSGFVTGAHFCVTEVAPSGSPVAVNINGCVLCLRNADLQRYVLVNCHE